MTTKPDPYLALAGALLPPGETINDVLDSIGVGEISFEERLALVQTGALVSIARSLRSIDQGGLQTTIHD